MLREWVVKKKIVLSALSLFFVCFTRFVQNICLFVNHGRLDFFEYLG